MFSKSPKLTPSGKLLLAAIIIFSLFLAYLLLFHPPRAEATKTKILELKEEGGEYDGKVTFTRGSDNVLILQVDSVLFEIENNDITIGGKILYRADGTDVSVQDGGTAKSSWTQYAIPYLNTTTSFSEIAIGTAGQVLKVNTGANGYEWANDQGLFQQLVTVAKSGGDFTTIQAAINSITDATASKPYIVLVYPGVYSEQVTLTKSYVSIVGTQPAGVRMTEAQCSGVIITYSSSGAGDDIMTLWIKGGGATDLKGITIANLTVINSQSLGVGPAQEALDIGRGDTYGRAHEILITDCSFYGEQDTVFLNTGNPTFRDCYIEGENDCTAIADDSLFLRTYHYCHTATTSRSNLYLGRTGGVAFTVTFIGSTFDIAAWDSLRGVGHWAENNVTANFYNCTILPYSASGTWYVAGKTCTMNLYNTNGTGWDPDANFLSQEGEEISGDSTIKGGLNLGTAAGAGVGDGKFSGDITIHGGDLIGATGVALDLGEAVSARAIFTADRVRFIPIGANRVQVEWVGGTGNAAFNVFDDTTDTRFEVLNSSGTYVCDHKVEGYLATMGHEYLAHDIFPYTLDGGDVVAGQFSFSWNSSTMTKLVSITPSIYSDDLQIFINEAYSQMTAIFQAPTVTVYEGAGYSWAVDDVITVLFVYRK